MDIKSMTVEELTERKAAIAAEADAPDADLDALEQELRSIKEELDSRAAVEAQKAEIRSAVAEGAGETIKTIEKEERENKMTNEEIRNSKEYIEAYANYIKSGKDDECRALLTENVDGGTVPVPEYVYDIVKNAWEREGIMSRVRRAYLRGNLKVGFEISGDEAAIHTEGGAAVSYENLILGTVNLVPQSIKKAVQISDEVADMRGEEFLRYIYDEVAYRIAKKAADTLIAKIVACGTVSTTTCPAVAKITSTTISVGLVAQAMAQLSDTAANPVVIMNKATWGAFKAAQAANGYNYDPFEGLPVVFNNSLAAFSAATTGVAYMIVGDLAEGAIANFPNGDGITFKYDDMTLATADMIQVIGRQYVGLGVVAPNAFVKVCH